MTGAQRSRTDEIGDPVIARRYRPTRSQPIDERLEEPLPGRHGMAIPADAYVKIADEDRETVWDAEQR